MAGLVFLNCYGTPDRKNEERHAHWREADGGVPENAPHRANRAAPGPHDPRRGAAAVSEGPLQPDRPLRLRNAKTVRRVFADTLYWLAIFVPADAGAEAARAADVSDASLITTEEVLSEFLTAVSAHGDYTRRLACRRPLPRKVRRNIAADERR